MNIKCTFCEGRGFKLSPETDQEILAQFLPIGCFKKVECMVCNGEGLIDYSATELEIRGFWKWQ